MLLMAEVHRKFDLMVTFSPLSSQSALWTQPASNKKELVDYDPTVTCFFF